MIRAIASNGLAAALCGLLLTSSCGGKAKPVKAAVSNAYLGDCVNPEEAGVLSESPSLRAGHRDLNGDGEEEMVFADEKLCRRGNCYWNLFARRDACHRYVGTVAGASLELLDHEGSLGFRELRSWWKLHKGKRQLAQHYRFEEEGYRLVDVLVCHQSRDDGILCAAEEQEAIR